MIMTVSEIEKAIKKLPPDEFTELSEWFGEFEAEFWDKKIEADLESGKLKDLIDEAEQDFAEGKCKQL